MRWKKEGYSRQIVNSSGETFKLQIPGLLPESRQYVQNRLIHFYTDQVRVSRRRPVFKSRQNLQLLTLLQTYRITSSTFCIWLVSKTTLGKLQIRRTITWHARTPFQDFHTGRTLRCTNAIDLHARTRRVQMRLFTHQQRRTAGNPRR